MNVGIFVIVVLLLFIFGCVMFFPSTNETTLEKYETEARFEMRLNKLLKHVTTQEWNFYRKIFFKIGHKDPKFWKITTSTKSTGTETFEVTIDKLQFGFQKLNKKYECTGLNIISNKETISMNPPKEHFDIYDLFVEYIMWQVYQHNEREIENENKMISKEYQNLVKKANRAL